MGVDFDTSELTGLMSEFQAAGPKAKRASSADMTKIAAQFRDDAKAAVPVDTRELQASIHVRGSKDSRLIIADARHAFFVEFGTGDTAPQPYMWPQVPKATRALAEALGDITPFD